MTLGTFGIIKFLQYGCTCNQGTRYLGPLSLFREAQRGQEYL